MNLLPSMKQGDFGYASDQESALGTCIRRSDLQILQKPPEDTFMVSRLWRLLYDGTKSGASARRGARETVEAGQG